MSGDSQMHTYIKATFRAGKWVGESGGSFLDQLESFVTQNECSPGIHLLLTSFEYLSL